MPISANGPANGAQVPFSHSFPVAAGFTILSALVFTASHAVVRHLGGDLHPLVIAFFSNLFSALFYVPLLMRIGIGALRTEKFRLHVVRSFINVASLSTWYMALALIPIADAAALGLSAPLFLTIGAALFLGEAMKIRRWAAIGFGVVGALIIIRPGFGTLNIGFLFVILSGIFSAGTKLFAKHLSKWDSAVTCSAWVAILQTPLSFILALFFWTTPTLVQLGWLAVIGVLAALGHLTMMRAIVHVEVSSLEPFTYVRLLWAAIIGYFVFAEFPGPWTWAGAAVIIGATTYIVRREAILQRASGGGGYPPAMN